MFEVKCVFINASFIYISALNHIGPHLSFKGMSNVPILHLCVVWNLHKSHLFDLSFPPIDPRYWLPIDEPAFVSIMTHDHAKDVCASELGPMRI